jgi:hypothetical protein
MPKGRRVHPSLCQQEPGPALLFLKEGLEQMERFDGRCGLKPGQVLSGLKSAGDGWGR